MNEINRRLSGLEKAAAPKRPEAFVVLQDGQYSQNGQPLTAEEYARLKEVCDVVLFNVVYVKAPGHEND